MVWGGLLADELKKRIPFLFDINSEVEAQISE